VMTGLVAQMNSPSANLKSAVSADGKLVGNHVPRSTPPAAMRSEPIARTNSRFAVVMSGQDAAMRKA
jgi:hypothetical protein